MTTPRVMITGAAGFIGSNLTMTLINRGYEVVAFDNLSQGTLDNLTTVADHPRFSLVEADIRDKDAVTKAAEGCQAIVHLAAYKIPRYSDAYDTLMINALGSEHVAQAAIATKAKIIAASTSDVYGKNPQVPFNENSNLVVGNPDVKRWSYAISKMFEEQLLFALHERFGLDVVLLRFFGGYGPHQNMTWWGGPQSVFINHALDDQAIPIHGDGQQTRSFTYVGDHVAGITSTIELPAANNLVFNLGATQEITIEGLARLIWRLVRGEHEQAKIEFIPYESFGKYEDVMRRVPDITRARTLLGFEPQTDLETGLRRTILWQVARRRALGIPTIDPVCLEAETL
ncbi:MAG: GDP-mannose 4,6-dehydratase [Anaerolineae bacterium]|nr:GDP-mannose 4,6-dehydratase [Anaerolineae bacterium]